MDPTKEFYNRFAGIGVGLTGTTPDHSADIERTIIEATEYVEVERGRLIGLLASWISVHGGLVNVTRLKRLLAAEASGDKQMIAALAFLAVANGFHTWKPLCKKYPEKALWGESTLRALKFKKTQKDFKRAGLLFPEDFLRIRESDILEIEKLAKTHRLIHYRLLFGVNPRADVAFYLSNRGEKNSTRQEIMKAVCCSYEPIYRILRNFTTAGVTQSLRQQRI